MAMYIGEEDVWKCLKHPSKRNRSGICPVCLRDRLIVLCPECANLLPCSCYASSSSSSSAASSSSGFSFFSSLSSSGDSGGRVSDLIDREPAFRRSRSVGIPYIFSRFAGDKIMNQRQEPPIQSQSKIMWFLSKFKMNSTRKRAETGKNKNNHEESNGIHANTYVCRNSNSCSGDDFASLMMKSRSVQIPMKASAYVKSPAVAVKKVWNFRSPMKAFRHSPKTSSQ